MWGGAGRWAPARVWQLLMPSPDKAAPASVHGSSWLVWASLHQPQESLTPAHCDGHTGSQQDWCAGLLWRRGHPKAEKEGAASGGVPGPSSSQPSPGRLKASLPSRNVPVASTLPQQTTYTHICTHSTPESSSMQRKYLEEDFDILF